MAYHSFLKSITLVVLTQGVLHFLTAGKILRLVIRSMCALYVLGKDTVTNSVSVWSIDLVLHGLVSVI